MDLLILSSRLLDLLGQAKHEAVRSANESVRNYGPEWATEAIENISRYRNKLEAAVRERDPAELDHAAGQFAVLPRYVNDYDYSWFSGDRALSDLIAVVHKRAASIVTSIDTFDPDSLERARKSLL